MALKLTIDPLFQPCQLEDDDECFPNGIFVFNITKMIAFVNTQHHRFPVEVVTVANLHAFGSDRLADLSINQSDLSKPVLLAEIAPGQFNLIDGHHRVARARREGVTSLPCIRIHCPHHIPFLTQMEAYNRYIEYWNSKVDSLSKGHVPS